MAVDLSKLILHTGYNSFKNVAVHRGNLTLPTSLNTSSVYTNSISFTLDDQASFTQAYMYTSDYSQYFQFLDSGYHDAWRQINANNDNLIFTSSGLYYYYVRMTVNANVVTFTLYAPKATAGTPTVRHPTGLVPITFTEYRLAN